MLLQLANLSHRHHSISLRSLVIFFLPRIAGHNKKIFRHWSFLMVMFDVDDATNFCEVPVITHPPRPGQQVIVSPARSAHAARIVFWSRTQGRTQTHTHLVVCIHSLMAECQRGGIRQCINTMIYYFDAHAAQKGFSSLSEHDAHAEPRMP